MILTDQAIKSYMDRGEIRIEPHHPQMLQPASLDLRLGKDLLFQRYQRAHLHHTDPKQDSTGDWGKTCMPDEGALIHPEDFVLGATHEKISLGAVAARFEGKSSLGRIGLMTHVTAGFIDPGFSGHITVELKNVSNKPIRLYPGMKIGQVCFYQLAGRVENPYGSGAVGSHYQGQSKPTPSRIHENFHQTIIP